MDHFWKLLACLFIIGLCACVPTFEVPQPSAISAAVPAAQRATVVALVITPDLKQAKWSESRMGDALVIGSKQMLQSLFGTVVLVSEPKGITNATYYITPSMERIEHSVGASAFSEQVFTMAVKWSVVDQKGQIVLLDTIVSEGRGPVGSAFTVKENTENTLGRLIDDTFAKARAKLASVLVRS